MGSDGQKSVYRLLTVKQMIAISASRKLPAPTSDQQKNGVWRGKIAVGLMGNGSGSGDGDGNDWE